MKKMPVAKHLTDKEYMLLIKVYADHNCSMGIEERKNYTLSDIVRVEKNLKEGCLDVHYKNGEWFHYCIDGRWY